MSEQEEKEEQPVVRRDATVTVTAITVGVTPMGEKPFDAGNGQTPDEAKPEAAPEDDEEVTNG
jgi:hypothetical protein